MEDSSYGFKVAEIVSLEDTIRAMGQYLRRWVGGSSTTIPYPPVDLLFRHGVDLGQLRDIYRRRQRRELPGQVWPR